jgi:putative membrane-bound dehydrogenase-like protein
MKRLALTGAVLLPALAWGLAAQPPAAGPNKVRLNGHTFTLPPGFEIELAAGPPLVDRPIAADFDEQGRLYVSDSSGSNEKVTVQLEKKPHRIVRLESSRGDGRFDKGTVFADKMMFPEGVMWHAGSLYVAAPPSIWKLTDTDGDGVADQRSEWFKGKTLTGCANDLHGPYAGPDGWIYWCKGAFAPQTYELPGRGTFKTRAAHIFRARPDGTGVEPVMTGGMDNPVDVVFTPGGERIFTTTFLQFPGGGKRDGLIHAVYGGVYGKDWDVIHEPAHPWTAPAVMPVLTHLGAAAPSGLHRYESNAFGEEYRDNLFACLFNMQKVTRHVLTPDGATFNSRDEDFLVSDNKDFHPTDVIEDADGSLLIVDTGGWYKLCCPTSQLVKPDVLGAIYRVRRKGAPRVEDPRGLKLDWAKMSPKELTQLLDDARPFVRRRAIQTLGATGADAVRALAETIFSGRTPEARRNAIWAATRIDGEKARDAVRNALVAAHDQSVCQVAAHSAGLWRDRGAVPALLKRLSGPAWPHSRRAAAEALGRIGDHRAVMPLLIAASRTTDRFLEHSLTYALIEIADPELTAEGLKSPHTGTRRAALVALDQMGKGTLRAEAVAKELTAADAKLKATAWWIASRHPEWAAVMAGPLRERLPDKRLTAAEQDELAGQLGGLARGAAGQGLLAERLRDPKASAQERRIVLRAMARSNVKEAPAAWTDALAQALERGGELTGEAVASIRALRLPKARPEKLVAALLKVGNDEQAPEAVRLGALAAVPGGPGKIDSSLFAFVQARVKSDQAVAVRGLAAEVLARARLSHEQLIALAATLKTAGPMEVNRLLEAFGHSVNEEVGRHLVAALKASAGKAGLRAEAIRPHLKKFGPTVQKDAEALYAALETDTARERAKLERLLTTLEKGDLRRGQAVFNGAKAACSSCHAIGYLGGRIGPDLTHIARIRTERDLLEAIVFPSASFVRGYEPVLVTTREGKQYSGVVRKDAADEIVLATSATEEVRVAREDIEDIRPSRVSLMPSGLDQQLTPRELADLVAFLKACK